MAEDGSSAQGVGEQAPNDGEGTDYKALSEKLQAELDKAKANSKKWESRSKANAEKAKLSDENAEKAATFEERLSKLEAENKSLKEERDRSALVAKVAKASGLDASLVGMLSAPDEDGLTEQAEALAEAIGSNGYPTVNDQGPHGLAGGLTEEEVEKIKNPAERVRARAERIHNQKGR